MGVVVMIAVVMGVVCVVVVMIAVVMGVVVIGVVCAVMAVVCVVVIDVGVVVIDVVVVVIDVVVIDVVVALLRSAAGTGSGGVLGTDGGVRLVGAGLVVRMAVPVTLAGLLVGGRVRVKPLLHVHQVEVGHVVVAQLLVVHVDHLDFAQAQAEQQALEALEVQPVLLAVAAEQLLDVEALLLL